MSIPQNSEPSPFWTLAILNPVLDPNDWPTCLAYIVPLEISSLYLKVFFIISISLHSSLPHPHPQAAGCRVREHFCGLKQGGQTLKEKCVIVVIYLEILKFTWKLICLPNYFTNLPVYTLWKHSWFNH